MGDRKRTPVFKEDEENAKGAGRTRMVKWARVPAAKGTRNV